MNRRSFASNILPNLAGAGSVAFFLRLRASRTAGPISLKALRSQSKTAGPFALCGGKYRQLPKASISVYSHAEEAASPGKLPIYRALKVCLSILNSAFISAETAQSAPKASVTLEISNLSKGASQLVTCKFCIIAGFWATPNIVSSELASP